MGCGNHDSIIAFDSHNNNNNSIVCAIHPAIKCLTAIKNNQAVNNLLPQTTITQTTNNKQQYHRKTLIMTTTIDDLPLDVLGNILAYAVPPNENTITARSSIVIKTNQKHVPPSNENERGTNNYATTTLPTFQRVSKSWSHAIRSNHAAEAWNIACRQTFPGSRASTRRDYLHLHHPRVQSAGRTVQRAVCKFFAFRRWIRTMRIDGRDDDDLTVTAAAARDRERGGCVIFPCCVCGIRWGNVSEDATCQLYSCPFVPRSERNVRHFRRRSTIMTMMYPSWFYRHHHDGEQWETKKSRFFICGSCSSKRPDMAMVSLRCPYLVLDDRHDATVVCFKCAEVKDGMLDHHRLLFDEI
mmetsp:Transcript_7651/g.15872  ORF Transcript_7651/g.15872 Transcript_7651/m.15872 type:complete len:355 (+) Transcript_7651:89-1153(+)